MPTARDVIGGVTHWISDEDGEHEVDVGFMLAGQIIDALYASGYRIVAKRALESAKLEGDDA